MSAHRSAPIERVEVITGGARRRWSTVEKRASVADHRRKADPVVGVQNGTSASVIGGSSRPQRISVSVTLSGQR